MAAIKALLALSMALAGTALGGSSSRLVMSPLHLRSADSRPDLALNVSIGTIKEPMHYSGYFQVATLVACMACLQCCEGLIAATGNFRTCLLLCSTGQRSLLLADERWSHRVSAGYNLTVIIVGACR